MPQLEDIADSPRWNRNSTEPIRCMEVGSNVNLVLMTKEMVGEGLGHTAKQIGRDGALIYDCYPVLIKQNKIPVLVDS